MSANSKIEWTEKTWNPIAAFLKRDITVTIGGKEKIIPKGTRGWFCVKVSPGCANCYAEAINLRLGNGLTYVHRNLADVEFRLVNLTDPLKWKKPQMVFVNSMTDLFLEQHTNEMIDAVFAVMALTPRHTFQVLTKRHELMRDYMVRLSKSIEPLETAAREIGYTFKFEYEGRSHPLLPFPIHNVWLGVSVEDQKRADERIPLLLETPAAIRFLSCEPLLGHVVLPEDQLAPEHEGHEPFGINWVIVGGESGPRARPCNIEWVRSIVNQCKSNGVPVFVKQLGCKPYWANPDARSEFDIGGGWLELRSRKGGDPSEWPEDVCVREFPTKAVSS